MPFDDDRPFDDESVLRAYLARLMTMQDERETWLDQKDLDDAARDLGLSDEDLRHVAAETDRHRERARQFHRHKDWDDAIAEYRKAAVLAPFDVDLLHELGVALGSRYAETQNPEDRAAAERVARRCIDLDPGHSGSYELLAALEDAEARDDPAPAAPRARLVAAAAVAVVLAVGFALAALVGREAPPRVAPPTPTRSAPPPSSPSPVPMAGGLELERPSERIVPVELVGADELDLHVQRSLLNDYDSTFAYRLHATLHPDTDEVRRLRLRLELFDQAGALLLTEYVRVREEHHPPLRPGDAAPLSHLVFRRTPAPAAARVRLTPERYEHTPAAVDYGEDALVPLDWTAEEPAGTRVVIRERRSDLRDGLGGPMHFLTLSVSNQGTSTLERLKLEAVWYGADGAVLAESSKLVVSSAGPALRAGQTWPVRFIQTLPRTEPFARYALHVTEAE